MKKKLILSLSMLVVLSACGKSSPKSSSPLQKVSASITATGCRPDPLELKAGATQFTITNDGASGSSEFEILDGDKIIGEVEGVSEGLKRTFAITLKSGEFVTYCPGTSHERGVLKVSDSGSTSSTSPATTTAAVNSYRDYLVSQTNLLSTNTAKFVQAVKDGDIAKSKSTYADARAPYEAVEPVAESFGDLDPKIDARENDVEAGQTWTGFHRIEKALWSDNSLAGMSTVADQLMSDVNDLQTKVKTVELEPAQIANGAVELLNEISTSKITGEEERYSHIDLVDFAANLAGSRAAFDSVKGLMKPDDADTKATIEQRFTDTQNALDKFKDGSSYKLFTSLSATDTKSLSDSIDALAEPLSKVATAVI